MNAMTWYDHETKSRWSQPWGRAIDGKLKGVQLNLLPSQITTWSNWVQENPDTLVMSNDTERLGNLRQDFDPDFVIGLILDKNSKAYYYQDAHSAGVINDQIGDVPILLWVSEQNFHAYIRQVGSQFLDFYIEDEQLKDNQTGSTWNPARGLAVEGELKGQALQPVPSMSSYDWAWEDFYPDSDFYSPK